MATLTRALAGLFVFLPALSVAILAGSKSPQRFPIYLVIFTLAWLWTRRHRREGWGEGRLTYEDIPKVVADLGISELVYRHEPLTGRRLSHAKRPEME